MIKDVIKEIVVQIIVALIGSVAIFLIGYFALDFAGVFEQFPKESSLLVAGCVVLIVTSIVWVNISARKKLEESYSGKIKSLTTENETLKRDYGVVNHELLRVKANTVEKRKEMAIKQSSDREGSWSQRSK